MSFPPGRDHQPSPFSPASLSTGSDEPSRIAFVRPPAPAPRPERVWLHVVLLLLTIGSTTLMGACHYLSFQQGFEPLTEEAGRQFAGVFSQPSFYLHGLWYSLTVLGILGCHEMGHYVACLRYRVDATLPYFLPAPPPLITGTLGAVIRIRDRFPSRLALFDIGIAGPIAGFIVAVPALFLGLWMSELVKLPQDQSNLMSLGEPLMFRFASWLVFGQVADGYSINLHPMAFAAWFGLLATAINLMPALQLDGGHICYALFKERSRYLSIVTIAVLAVLSAFSLGWIVWTLLLTLMARTVGLSHPPTLDDYAPLGSARLWLALFALVMLIVCFTPAPIEPFVAGSQ